MEEYLTTPQAAEKYKISVSSLTKWRVFGGGPRFIKLGKKVLYRVSDFDAWMDAKLVASTSQRKAA